MDAKSRVRSVSDQVYHISVYNCHTNSIYLSFLFKSIPPNVKRIVSCNAIRSGGEMEWNFAVEHYLKSNVGAEKEMLLGALACTTKPWILGK